MLAKILQPEIVDLIQNRKFSIIKEILLEWSPADIADLIESLPVREQAILFRILSTDLATETFEHIEHDVQLGLLKAMGNEEVRVILNEMSPDDRTAFLEELPAPITRQMLALLSPDERKVAKSLLGYPEESIGRLMTPDYIAILPDWTVEQTLNHIREHGEDSETLNIIYVIDERGRLIDDLKIREFLLAPLDMQVLEMLDGNFVHLEVYDDQETAVDTFKKYDRIALPVTDAKGLLIGIVTVDDVLDVAEEEATEDIHKLGGVEALDAPYATTRLLEMVKKRAGWLSILFIGETLTAFAMGFFEGQIAKAAVLVLFIPLIISSGGNSGSQAATLVIRALSLGEITLKDWWTVMKREILSGLLLGAILAIIGFLKIMFLHLFVGYFGADGDYWYLIGITVGLTLVGIVLWGTLAGSMLPIVMQRLGFDPATSSAPFVATLVDVTGLVIYFTFAIMVLSGTLL